MTTKEIWEMTPDKYLAPYRQAEKTADDAYDTLYRKHCKVGEYPLNGDMWERYGQRLDAACETTELRLDPSYKRLQRERQRATNAVSDARRTYEKAIKKAVREGKLVSSETPVRLGLAQS